jgi:hypothetical protein
MYNTNTINVEFSNPLLLDRVNELAKEYSITPDFLISMAVKKLIYDVDFLRKLRAGELMPE